MEHAIMDCAARLPDTSGTPAFPDPLGPDATSDQAVTMTRRGLVRLALVAAETGARFQRDGIGHDPMAWLLAPRRVFGGEAAIDACGELPSCMRALLLHGLGLGLDADPSDVDALMEDDHNGDCGAGDATQPVRAPAQAAARTNARAAIRIVRVRA